MTSRARLEKEKSDFERQRKELEQEKAEFKKQQDKMKKDKRGHKIEFQESSRKNNIEIQTSHWSAQPNHQKVRTNKVFEHLYKTTVEPILTYAMEAWYPSQVTLQTSVERVKKYATKLVTNNFQAFYQSLLKWKPISQIAAERRDLLMHHYYYGQRKIPAEALVLRREAVERLSIRIGHDKKFHLPPISSETTLQSSVNVAKSIWNALPAETVSTSNPQQFKRLIQQPKTYQDLAKAVAAVRRKELSI